MFSNIRLYLKNNYGTDEKKSKSSRISRRLSSKGKKKRKRKTASFGKMSLSSANPATTSANPTAQQSPNGSIPSSTSTTPSASYNNSTSSVTIVQCPPAKKQIIAIGAEPTKPKLRREVTELKCADVRWFYKRPDDSKWSTFKGYDSTVLEVAYRRAKNIELDEDTKKTMQNIIPATAPENGIVMDGNYRADDKLENVEAIYWKQDSYQITRGTWFYLENGQPLPADFADTIEANHIQNFKGQMIPDAPVFSDSETSRKPELTTVKWGDEKVCWNSVIDVHIAPQKSNAVIRFITRSRGSVPLRRGYTEEANAEEGKPNFSDLILVVHGIGQKGYENLIAQNTAQIREAIHHQMDKYYSDEKRRPAILPIEWRSSLQLDSGITDVVTLPKMPAARSTLNSVCMDLMYYQSPLYRSEIVNGVLKALNSVYSTFMENNPDFSGPISIIGHSLGSVIAYDILTNWSPFLLYDQFVTNKIAEHMRANCSPEQKQLLEQFYNSRKRMLELGDLMEQILVRQEEPLKFKVKYLFCLGSPLAVFIIMRGADYRSVVPRSDQVERIFNIFHPYDPVAYRLEPMFHENYKYIRPLKLFNYADAIKSYENAIYECHDHYLRKCKERRKKEGKEAAKNGTAKKDKEAAKEKENVKSESNKNDDAKTSTKQKEPQPIEEAEDEQRHLMDDTDSDLEQASSARTNVSTPRSLTPQEIGSPTANHTATATPSTPVVQNPLEGHKNVGRESDGKLTVDTKPNGAENAADSGPASPEQAIEATEECEEEHSGTPPQEEEALPASDDKAQAGGVPGDNSLKSMGEAGQLIEQIPPERRITQRIDFQVQPWVLDKSYWSMLKSHFSYWANLDVAAFLLNTLYPPPLELPGVTKPGKEEKNDPAKK